MSRNGSGTYTLPAGNPVVTGTTIEASWANTTLSDIATTLTDSLSRSGQGGMTAALRIADGTQAAPGLGFANETGSGFYRASTAEVWAVIQGAQTMNLDSTGVTVPVDKATSIEGTFVFNETGADKDARFEGDTDVNLLFLDASTDRIGIGTSSPGSKLEVAGQTAVKFANPDVAGIVLQATTGTNAAAMKFTNTGGNGYVGLDSSSGNRIGGGAYSLNVWHEAAYPIAFGTNNTLRMLLDSSGNLGLGVTPSAWSGVNGVFEIKGNAYIYSTTGVLSAGANAFFNGTNWIYKTTQAATRYEQVNGQHQWSNAASGTAGNTITFTQAMTLDALGALGVNDTSPTTRGRFVVRSTDARYFAVSTAGQPTFRYDDNGVTDALLVNSGIAGAGHGMGIQAQLGDSGANTATAGYIRFLTDGTWSTASSSRDAYMSFGTTLDGTVAERARITSGGDFLVGTTSNALGQSGIIFTTAYNGVNSAGIAVQHANGSASGDVYLGFIYNGAAIGAITQNGTTAVAYNTTSDRRLKDNIVPAPSASDVIDAIQIVSHDWKAAPDEHVTYGVIAQDLHAVAPQAVLQGDDGDEIEKAWGVDYSKLVPMLIKEIQSLRARVAALEAQP